MSGYIVDSPASARDALEPLMAAYDFAVAERDGVIVFFHNEGASFQIEVDAFSAASAARAYARRDVADLPIEARVRFIDAERDYLIATASARRLDRVEGGVASLDAPLVLGVGAAEALAERMLAERRAAAETLQIGLGPTAVALEPGDRVTVGDDEEVFQILRIEDAGARELELRRVSASAVPMLSGVDPGAAPLQVAPTPALSVLDLPPLPGEEDDDRPLVAIFASPWVGAHEVFAGVAQARRATIETPAIMGELVWALWPGPVDRLDQGNVCRIALYGGDALASVTRMELLDGANAFAIEADGEWELIQAEMCELVAPGVYDLSGFLRGRLGSAHAMRAPHPVGARIIKMDRRLARADVAAHEWGEALKFIAPPSEMLPTSARAEAATVTLPHAAVRPWAPAHVRAARAASGDVLITWVRCARLGGDSWGPGEPPVGVPTESYVLEVLDGSDPVRTEATDLPSFTYSAAAQTADFGILPGSLHIRVAQVGESGATGLNTELTITL
ncbi:MAG: phage tail protein [Hyphomonadaceae bacterium]